MDNGHGGQGRCKKVGTQYHTVLSNFELNVIIFLIVSLFKIAFFLRRPTGSLGLFMAMAMAMAMVMAMAMAILWWQKPSKKEESIRIKRVSESMKRTYKKMKEEQDEKKAKEVKKARKEEKEEEKMMEEKKAKKGEERV